MAYSGVWCIFFVAGSIAAIVRAQKYIGETGLLVAGVGLVKILTDKVGKRVM